MIEGGLPTMEDSQGRLKLSRLFTLTIYAVSYRPLMAIALAVLTIYLPGRAIEHFFPAPDEVFSIDFALWSLKVTPISAIGSLFQGWIAIQALHGNASAGALQSTWERSNAIYLTCIVVTQVALVGLFLLVVPGVVWGLVCTVAVPVAVIERRGIVESIKRSMELTKGRLWALFGYAMVILLSFALVSVLIDLAFVGGRFEQLDASPAKPVTELLSAILNAAFTAAAYVELVALNRAQQAPVNA